MLQENIITLWTFGVEVGVEVGVEGGERGGGGGSKRRGLWVVVVSEEFMPMKVVKAMLAFPTWSREEMNAWRSLMESFEGERRVVGRCLGLDGRRR